MKKSILWILAAWLLTMVAVSCSDDDDIDLSASIGPRFENGNVFIGKTKLPNDPVEIGTLPQWLQDEIGKETMFLLLEGTWKGERAYLFDKQWIPRLPQTLLVENQNPSLNCDYFEREFEYYEVNWKEWKCIYHWKWYNKD